jgi:ketopantoate reductase
MKKILIVGMGACGLATVRALSAKGLGDVTILAPENINEHEETMQQRQLSMETILLTAPPKFETEYIPTKREVESYHPFSKFMGRKKKDGKRGRW